MDFRINTINITHQPYIYEDIFSNILNPAKIFLFLSILHSFSHEKSFILKRPLLKLALFSVYLNLLSLRRGLVRTDIMYALHMKSSNPKGLFSIITVIPSPLTICANVCAFSDQSFRTG